MLLYVMDMQQKRLSHRHVFVLALSDVINMQHCHRS